MHTKLHDTIYTGTNNSHIINKIQSMKAYVNYSISSGNETVQMQTPVRQISILFLCYFIRLALV